jgi:hypothetical protein
MGIEEVGKRRRNLIQTSLKKPSGKARIMKNFQTP